MMMLDITECKTFYNRRANDSHFHVFRLKKQNKLKQNQNKQYSELILY